MKTIGIKKRDWEMLTIIKKRDKTTMIQTARQSVRALSSVILDASDVLSSKSSKTVTVLESSYDILCELRDRTGISISDLFSIGILEVKRLQDQYEEEQC